MSYLFDYNLVNCLHSPIFHSMDDFHSTFLEGADEGGPVQQAAASGMEGPVPAEDASMLVSQLGAYQQSDHSDPEEEREMEEEQKEEQKDTVDEQLKAEAEWDAAELQQQAEYEQLCYASRHGYDDC